MIPLLFTVLQTPLLHYSLSGIYNPDIDTSIFFFESLDLIDQCQTQPRHIGNDGQGNQQDDDEGQASQV